MGCFKKHKPLPDSISEIDKEKQELIAIIAKDCYDQEKRHECIERLNELSNHRRHLLHPTIFDKLLKIIGHH